jgi:hypothetical protein
METYDESVIANLGLISGDAHINEPRNLWRDNLPESLRSQAMRGIKPGAHGDWELLLDGDPLGAHAEHESDRLKIAEPSIAMRCARHCRRSCARPSVCTSGCSSRAQAASCRVYNEWIADRLGGLPRFRAGIVPALDVNDSVAEVSGSPVPVSVR